MNLSQETCLLEYRIFRTTSNWLYVFIHHDWRVMVFMLVFEKENGLFSSLEDWKEYQVWFSQ